MPGSLTHSPAVVVKHLLVALSQGTLPENDGSWPVYATQEPTKPDSTITVYDTTGITGDRDTPTNERPENNGIQVRVKSPNYAAGYTKSSAIALAMDGVTKNAVNIPDATGTGSTDYTVWTVIRTSDVLSLGKESPTSRRDLFTINALVSLRQA